MKKLVSSTAIAVLMSGGIALPAFAQNEMRTDPPAAEREMTAPTNTEASRTTERDAGTRVTLLKTLPQNSRPISEYYQEPVYDTDDNRVGDSNDLLIDENGRVTTVIIGVGGFLGIGEKNVAIPFDALMLTRDDDDETRLTVNASREALEDAPGYTFDAEANDWVPAESRQNDAAEGRADQGGRAVDGAADTRRRDDGSSAAD